MIGIYKITNIINNHSYIGQSIQIEERWKNHIEASNNKNAHNYKYPLYKAIRKYGISKFQFEILEECSKEQLNEREYFWIKTLSPEYNQTCGGDYLAVSQKLTYNQVQEIQKLLINDQNGTLSHKELANKYQVSKDTIRDINVGRTWFDSNLTYPLHYSKFNPQNPNKQKYYCIDCGKEVSTKQTLRCRNCANILLQSQSKIPIERDILKQLIRTKSFTQIGKDFGVSDNTIRKWCDKYNLPRSARLIKSYSDIIWETI